MTEEEYKRYITQMAEFARAKRLALKDLNARQTKALLKKYSRKDIATYIENPDRNYEKLQEMSWYFYAVSPNYKRLINYLSELPTDNYYITPVDTIEDIDTFKELYVSVCKKYKRWGLKDILPDIRKHVLITGEFFGVYFENKNDFCLRKLPNKYCRIASIEGGVLCFSFDLDFFNDKENFKFIKEYGNDFVKAYRKYKGDKELGIEPDKTLRWFEPKNQICVKLDKLNFEYSLPYFVGLFDSVLDVGEYSQIKKDRTVAQNSKIITLEMSTNDSGLPAMDLEIARPYYDMVSNSVPDNVGVALAPFKFGNFNLQDTNQSDNDIAMEANKNFWNNAGVSSLLFGVGDNPTSQTLLLSVKTDEVAMFKLNTQIARVIDVRYRRINPKCLFSINFLEQSIFNKEEVTTQLIKGSTYGLPNRLMVIASLGLEPIDAINMIFLEEQVFRFTIDSLNRPLLQSSTLSPDSEGGRPTNESQGLGTSDSTEKGMDNNGENR